MAAGADFTAGRYTATFTSGANTATANIPIVADDIDEPTEQFSLRLYIDGDGYGVGVQKGNAAKAVVNIVTSKFSNVEWCCHAGTASSTSVAYNHIVILKYLSSL